MSNEKVRELLARLHDEVQQTDIDEKTRASLEKLDSQIHRLLDPAEPESNIAPVLERAKLLEARFAMDHPTIERFMREVIDTLGKIGI